ncbi:MAG: deoxyribodipyrimidine photolyase [Gemmatimonadota bacterium]
MASSDSPAAPIPSSRVPPVRLQTGNDAPVAGSGGYVLYWMIAFRRLDSNFALERAVEWARHLGKPLLIFEALRAGYPWASQRLHRFALDGMADHDARLEGARVGYFPYVEPEQGAGKGLLERLARDAAVVVTDDFPCFFLPRMVASVGPRLPVRLEVVDSNGLLPLRTPEPDQVFGTAYAFRRFLQANLPAHLEDFPRPHPLQGDPLPPFPGLPEDLLARWPRAGAELLSGKAGAMDRLSLPRDPAPVPYPGGGTAAGEVLARFLGERIHRYGDERNIPDLEVASGLSPYLHWGHISTHEIFQAVAREESWRPHRLASRADGKRSGWWGMGANAESFLDELVTWRELGFNMTSRRDDYDRYESLPDWALDTLEDHSHDPRPHLYTLAEFRDAETHDPLWNAAQRQLLREGRIHNYLRMLWGKKILEWTPHPRKALEVMVELNNRYAVDGRNPNSWSGIFWTLGRYDRGWPERPIFGKVRSMTSDSTRRKVSVEGYLKRFGP